MTPCGMPLISVIIPTYNQAKYLEAAIRSVLGQTFQDFEILVVDDGSTDCTSQVVHGVSDFRIQYIRQENQGLSAARNTGIAASTGRYLAFLDSDDIFLPTKLEHQLRFLESHPGCDLVAGGFIYIDERGDTIRENHLWKKIPSLDYDTWLYRVPYVIHSILIRREWVVKVAGFDVSFRQLEDWDFGLRLLYAGCHMSWIEELVCCYRLHQANMTRSGISPGQGFIPVLNKFFNLADLPNSVLDKKNSAYAYAHLRSARLQFAANCWEEGGFELEQSAKIEPGFLDNQAQFLQDQLVSWSIEELSIDSDRYMDAVYEHLPVTLQILRQNKPKAIADVNIRMLFLANEKADNRVIRSSFWKILLNDPARLLNRGILAVFYKSLFR